MKDAWYDQEEDVLNIELKKGEYWKTIELQNGVNIDIAKDGSIISIEILAASKSFLGKDRLVLDRASIEAEA